MTTRDLDQLIAEQNAQYARYKPRPPTPPTPEEEREIAKQRRELERERLASERAFRWGERRDSLLRGIGYPTRTIVFLIMIGLWIAVFDTWLRPDNISDRPLGSLTLKEIAGFIFWGFVGLGVLFLLFRRLINYKEEEIIDWESWGRFGLGVVAAAAAVSAMVATQMQLMLA